VLISSLSCFAQQEIESLLIKLDSTKKTEDKLLLYKQVARYYQNDQAHLKAVEYWGKANEIQKNLDQSNRKDILEAIASNYSQLGKYKEAITSLEEVLQQKNLSPDQQSAIYSQLADLAKRNNNYEEAIQYTQANISLLENTKNNVGIIQAYNNLGVIYQEKGNTTAANNALQKAISLGLQLEQNTKELEKRAILYLNVGTTYSNLGDTQSAQYHFMKSLDFWEKQKNAHKIAQVRNYLAANYYISGNNANAINYAQQSAELSRLNNDDESLLTSYQILALAYQVEGDITQAQQYQNQSAQLGEKVRERKRKIEQEQASKQLEIEKKENEIRNIISDREKQMMSLAQAELVQQKQERELVLLKREQELQQSQIKAQELEKEGIKQLLELTRQKALADQKTQEAEKQTLRAEKEKIEREKADAQATVRLEKEKIAREAAEVQSKQQEKQLEQEQKFRYLGYAVLGLIGITLIIMIFSFINARRTTKKLRIQNKIIADQSGEINAQNEELFQNQEEILAQRDFISEKNKELETRNLFIQKSINAALNIQQAILPYQKKLDELLKDYFILYRPKDVVSGDFYWLNQVKNKTILVVADCTGHGVQGAFMTLIGNTLLDKIVRVWDITDPTQILYHLHEEISIVLRQEDTKNDDGMDLVVICFEKADDKYIKITFSGAKNSLYYILPDENATIQTLRGARRSIGGKQSESKVFENQEIILPKGSLIYTGSDGLIDQNNFERNRLGEKKLLKVLEANHHLSTAEQKLALEKALDAYMEGTLQRDDILWVGVRV
jgi:serine phosphatase RsbU (regulator of sigma subunit)